MTVSCRACTYVLFVVIIVIINIGLFSVSWSLMALRQSVSICFLLCALVGLLCTSLLCVNMCPSKRFISILNMKNEWFYVLAVTHSTNMSKIDAGVIWLTGEMCLTGDWYLNDRQWLDFNMTANSDDGKMSLDYRPVFLQPFWQWHYDIAFLILLNARCKHSTQWALGIWRVNCSAYLLHRNMQCSALT